MKVARIKPVVNRMCYPLGVNRWKEPELMMPRDRVSPIRPDAPSASTRRDEEAQHCDSIVVWSSSRSLYLCELDETKVTPMQKLIS
jgi:hypothetical protein